MGAARRLVQLACASCWLSVAVGFQTGPLLRARADPPRQSSLLRAPAAMPASLACARRSGPVMGASGSRGALNARLLGSGSCVPDKLVPNSALEAIVDTNDEWISKRTGISNRRLLAPGQGVHDLAATAAQRALEDAGVPADEVGLIVLATSTPDDLFGDAAAVASAIGAKNAVAFDLTAACSGFLFGVSVASQFLHTGAYGTAIVIGADGLSRWVDWSDRNTCVLFGDGAGAVVMKGAEAGEEAGVLGFEMHSDGTGRCDLNLGYAGEPQQLKDVATVTNGKYATVDMNGKEVTAARHRRVTAM